MKGLHPFRKSDENRRNPVLHTQAAPEVSIPLQQDCTAVP